MGRTNVQTSQKFAADEQAKGMKYLTLILLGCSLGLALPAAESALTWTNVAGVKIPIPPPEHPRLYLRAQQAAALPQRLKDPVLQPVVGRLERMAAKSRQFKAERDALNYLATREPALGRAAIETTLSLLEKCELPDRQDACRVTGRMMVTGAIVYDWGHALLTDAEKQSFIKELVRLAKTQECGYPPTRQGSVTGHSSEAMIMRDMMSAGIALYDEFPEMYHLAAARFFREHLPARNWFYSGHAYHQGDSYGAHRFSWDTYPLFIFDRLGAGNVFNPEQRYVPYLWIYTTRPDGQRLRAGDTFMHSRPRGQPWSEFEGTLFTASYYGDEVLLSQFLKQGGSGDNEAIFEFLWRDPALPAKPIEALPLARYFGSPFGWMVARTGWDENSVIAELKINEYNFANHQHLDAGAFQLFYRGALAIDSGLYSGSSGQYGSPHCRNYYWRTIAHNSLLVYDPDEQFSRNGDYGNDGGQRLPNGRTEPRTLNTLLAPENGYRTGKVLAHGFGPDPRVPKFTLLQGDITAAYGNKVQRVTRSFVFLNLQTAPVPAALVVFDRVVSAKPEFRKHWLLHTLAEPQVANTAAIVKCTEQGARGRLTLDVLLPRADNVALSKVGGPGREFWVFGANFVNDVDANQRARSSIEAGAWRLELTPKVPAVEDLFLSVMQVTDERNPARWPVTRLEASDRVGCVIEGPQSIWTVLARQDATRSSQAVQFTLPDKANCHILITDLEPGLWQAVRGQNQESRRLEVPSNSAAAWLEGQGGAWTLRRMGNNAAP
jgi:heparin/heparan-sulfate lyase